jgi:hypothetical protein
MELSTIFDEPRITFFDCVVIVMLCAFARQLYRNRKLGDERERKERRNAIIGISCVLLYTIGRVVLILVNQ